MNVLFRFCNFLVSLSLTNIKTIVVKNTLTLAFTPAFASFDFQVSRPLCSSISSLSESSANAQKRQLLFIKRAACKEEFTPPCVPTQRNSF